MLGAEGASRGSGRGDQSSPQGSNVAGPNQEEFHHRLASSCGCCVTLGTRAQKATQIVTFSRTSCCYAAKNLPPIRFRPLLISFLSWRLPIPGSSCGHAMRNVIAVALGLVDTEMTRGTKDEQCEPIVQCRRGLKQWQT